MAIRYDVNFINPFLQAVVDTFFKLANMKLTPGKPFVKEKDAPRGDISGVISIKGKLKGSIALTLSEGVAVGAVQSLTGEPKKGIDSDVRDLVGELTNIISGQGRRVLADMGHHFEAAIPEIIIGKEHIIKHQANGPILAIPFNTSEGELVVEICLEAGSFKR